jgi:CHAD domain-containing protein
MTADAELAQASADPPGGVDPGLDTDPGRGADPVAQLRPMEVELKYRMSDIATGERLLAADELAGLTALGPVERVRQEDRYLDTADGAVAAAGYAGRIRASNGAAVVTLKGLDRLDDGGAMHRREELEGPAAPGDAVSAWPASAARDALVAIVGDRALGVIVSLRQDRRRRRFGQGDSVVEVSVDDVEVVVGDEVVERFAELELELCEGDEAALEPLVERLAENEELVEVDGSKLERALEAVRRRDPTDARSGEATAAIGPAPIKIGPAAVPVEPDEAGSPGGPPSMEPAAVHATTGLEAAPEEAPRVLVPKSPGVLADDHIAEAARKVLRFHLARMVAREAGTREGTVAEELHGMRVATRRQRAAWRVFGDAFEPRRTARHRKRLRRVAADLGAVRDLDVLIEAIEAYRARLPRPEGAGLEPLVRSWRTRRDVARSLLVRELDSSGYQRWLDGYLVFVQAEGQGVRAVGPTEPHRVRDTMPARVWAAYERVRAYEPVMRWADVATLHELRIAAKGLRYTLEFVREALGRDAGPVIAKCVALQDHLGWLHDADVAAGLARAFLVGHAGDLTEPESAAIGRYLVDRERELARLRRSVGQPWRGVSSLTYRRAIGRLIAGL